MPTCSGARAKVTRSTRWGAPPAGVRIERIVTASALDDITIYTNADNMADGVASTP